MKVLIWADAWDPQSYGYLSWDSEFGEGKIRKAFGGAYIPCGEREVKIGKYEVLIC
jgi:hypothetical protein